MAHICLPLANVGSASEFLAVCPGSRWRFRRWFGSEESPQGAPEPIRIQERPDLRIINARLYSLMVDRYGAP